jgi:hypothetical protein
MTTEDHNRTIGILHLVYGAMHLFGMFFVVLFFVPMMFLVGSSGRPGEAGGEAFMTMIFLIVGVFSLLLSIPSFVAGIGMLKRKSWAKVWAMIAGGLAGMSFPMGTALCVYTFWFLFSGGGKEFYEGRKFDWGHSRPGVLHGAPEPANWQSRNRDRDYVNAHRSGPPDWRGE